ncbi:MAG: hypothetical protein AB8B63_16540 [Granulosicoccus sp.]
MNQLPGMSQIQDIVSLYWEILILLVAASLLGWVVGYMMKKSRSRKKLKVTNKTWKSKYSALEASARADAENLEDRLQTLGHEVKTLHATNNALTESMKKNDVGLQKARAESIDLNRQHAETQERLQRIIQQKDREIVDLGHRLNRLSTHASGATTTRTATEPMHADVSTFPEINDNELTYADTVAVSPAQIPAIDQLDATIQMSAPDNPVNTVSTPDGKTQIDAEGISDVDSLSLEDAEEATIALDDNALAFAQRSYPSRQRE